MFALHRQDNDLVVAIDARDDDAVLAAFGGVRRGQLTAARAEDFSPDLGDPGFPEVFVDGAVYHVGEVLGCGAGVGITNSSNSVFKK